MPQKHHYIPEFYLKQWAGPNSRLVEFCRRHHNKVYPRWTHPGGTGYVYDLYSIPNAPPHVKDVFEDKFMSVADGIAAHALRFMLDHRYVPTGEEKGGWTRFMMSLWYRTPEGVARSVDMIRNYYEQSSLGKLQPVYDQLKQPGDPPTAEEFLQQNAAAITSRTTIQHLMDIIESSRVREKIMEMQWHLGWIDNLKHPLLTGDRPIIMTNGIAHADAHIVMPLSPKYIFIAANTDDEVTRLKVLSRNGELAYRMNDRIVRQARKFVFASDPSQQRFVENRLGEKAACSPFE